MSKLRTLVDAGFEAAREKFEEVRPRTEDGRAITAGDALAIGAITGVAIGFNVVTGNAISKRGGRVDPMSTIGIVAGAAIACDYIYQNGVAPLIEEGFAVAAFALAQEEA